MAWSWLLACSACLLWTVSSSEPAREKLPAQAYDTCQGRTEECDLSLSQLRADKLARAKGGQKTPEHSRVANSATSEEAASKSKGSRYSGLAHAGTGTLADGERKSGQHGRMLWKHDPSDSLPAEMIHALDDGTGKLLAFAASGLFLAVCALITELRRSLEMRGCVTLACLASVFFGFDNFFVAHAGNVFQPVEYMSAMLLMVGILSALGSLLLATCCESFRSEAQRCTAEISTVQLVLLLCSGAFIALAQTCGCLSFSLDEANSGPHQSVVVANVPLVGLFFYIYGRETLSSQQIMGCSLIMAGVVYMSGLLSRPLHGQSVLQDRSFLWICVSCVFYAASIVTIRLAGDLPSRPKAASIMFLSGLLGFTLLRLLPSEAGLLFLRSPAHLVWPFFNAVASMLGLFSVVLSYEVPDSKAAVATAIIDSNSVPMCLLNYFLLGKMPEMSELIGMVMVLLGCSVASLTETRKSEAQ